jgi:hypothetical protein
MDVLYPHCFRLGRACGQRHRVCPDRGGCGGHLRPSDHLDNDPRLRIQEDARGCHLKLTQVMSDIVGVSGRAIRNALIAGETDPDRLADLTRGRLKRGMGGSAGRSPWRCHGPSSGHDQLAPDPNRCPRDGRRHD